MGKSTLVIEAIAEWKENGNNTKLSTGYYGEKEIVVTGGVNHYTVDMDYGMIATCGEAYSGSATVRNGVLLLFDAFANEGNPEVGALPLKPDDVFVIPKGRTAPRHMINRLPKQSHRAGKYFWGYAVQTIEHGNRVYKMIDDYAPSQNVKYNDGEGICSLYSVWEWITAKTTLITPAELKIYCGVGSKFKIPVVFEPAGAPAQSLYWDSDPASVATVDDDGFVTAVNVGQASIEIGSSSHPPGYNTIYTLVVSDYAVGDIIFNDGQKWTKEDLAKVSDDDRNAQKTKAVGVVFTGQGASPAKMVGLKEGGGTWYDAGLWASRYSTPATAGSAYAGGWYLPTRDELAALHQVAESDVVNAFLAVGEGSGYELKTATIWSSTEDTNNTDKAIAINFAETANSDYAVLNLSKTSNQTVCAIRELP